MPVNFLILVTLICLVTCKSLESVGNAKPPATSEHTFWKRFINPAIIYGDFTDNGFSRIRTKRGVGEECEKLRLCKLHAHSTRSFFAAFELYFVNKENARLWDHHARSVAECERRFGGCYR